MNTIKSLGKRHCVFDNKHYVKAFNEIFVVPENRAIQDNDACLEPTGGFHRVFKATDEETCAEALTRLHKKIADFYGSNF